MSERSAEKAISKAIPHGDCLLLRPHNATGYAAFKMAGKYVLAHRYVYEKAYGPLPPGGMACHTCSGNYLLGDITYRRCIKLEHLYGGDAKSNVEDAFREGRRLAETRHITDRTTKTCPTCQRVSTISWAQHYAIRSGQRSGRCYSCAAKLRCANQLMGVP